MLTDEIARAVQSAPRSRLAELAATIWRAYGAGANGETDAQALAEAVEARKRIPTVTDTAPTCRKPPTGS